MNLSSLVYTGKVARPPKVLIHGTHGVGKNTLAASMPKPIFVQTEDGSGQIDCAKMPVCASFAEFMEQLRMIYKEEHEYRTLVLDSLDWLEPLINAEVCDELSIKDISDAGFGAGYSHALKKFCEVIAALTAIHKDKNMAICLLAHSQIKSYQNLLGKDYDRFVIKLRDKVSDKFNEFVDILGFLHLPITTYSEKDGMKDSTKAVGGSKHVLSCYPHAAFESKNRYGIEADITIPKENGWDCVQAEINKN